ncbi:MAG: hypothetical protein J6U53_03755 [Tidjanibacter sp.]|nr:hypothetical protein [Tidjanibacter sp.]
MGNLQYDLDYALRNIDKDGHKYGYVVKKGKCYDRYMNNDSWRAFLKNMAKQYIRHYDSYKDGSGGEIKEGRYPPKMACYGSSSRFIYLLLRDVADVKFECPWETKVGGTAYLDAYIARENCEIFIEAKCREIYGSKNKSVKRAYMPVYDAIAKSVGDIYTNEGDIKGDKNRFKCEFKYKCSPIEHLDFKQLICHFLAISANYLTNDDAKNKIRFIYLIYNPSELGIDALTVVYAQTIEEIGKFDMQELFNAVFEFQKKNLNATKDMPDFEFVLANQTNIRNFSD